MGDRRQTGEPSRHVTSHPGQLSLAIPPWVGAMTTSESWEVNRHTVRSTSPISVVWQCKPVSGWGQMKRGSAPLYGPYGSGRTFTFFTLLSVIVVLVIINSYLNWYCIVIVWTTRNLAASQAFIIAGCSFLVYSTVRMMLADDQTCLQSRYVMCSIGLDCRQMSLRPLV